LQKKIYKIIAAIVVLILSLWAIVNLFNNFKNVDRDGDGVPDHEESKRGTDPTKKDTDNDGLDDKVEYDYWMNRSETEGDTKLAPDGDIDGDGLINILDEDSDGDGISDGQEIKNGTDPGKADTDNDGLTDGDELASGTDPTNPDSDGDGIQDGADSTPNGPQNPGDLTYGGSDPSQDEREPSRFGYDTTPTCFAVFDPYLGGLKRYVAFDKITEDYKAKIADPTPSSLELSSYRYQNVFVGTMTLELSSEYIRIPSVAPTANIIDYSTPDGLTLSFYKDGADNYYVKSSKTYGKTTLTFTTSADSSYYSLNVPEDLTLDDVPENVKHTPPSNVITKANTVINELGLTGEKNIKTIVNTLKSYFSSFTQGDIPSEEEEPDPYLAMALSKHGCCYIRSFACFVTANAIGLPTRLVTNECHAFCEVYIPSVGWEMLNLGGCGANFVNPDDNDPFGNITDNATGPGDGGDGGNDTQPTNLLPTSTTITDVSSIAYKEDYFNVAGYVKNQEQIGIEGITVQIFVNKTKNTEGEFAGSGLTNSNGLFSIECKVPENADVGTNQILAHAVRNDIYDESWSDPTIEIYSNTSLILDMAQSVGLGDYLSIKGYLVDASNQPVSGEIIEVNWDYLYVGHAITGSAGDFVYLYYVSQLGSHNIHIDFYGGQYLSSSSASQDVTVKDTKTKLVISVSPTTVYRGDQLSISGKLTSGSNDPMADSTIYILYSGQQISSAMTSSKGTFDASISVPMNSSVGENTVKTRYPGTTIYAEAIAEVKIKVISNTQLELTSPSKENIERNETIVISGTLKDDANQPAKNALINISWPIFNATVFTNEKGIFSINYSIPATATLGESTITTKFGGTNYYHSSQDAKQVNVIEHITSQQNVEDKSQNTYILLAIAAIIICVIIGVIMLFKKQNIQTGPSIEEIAARTIHELKVEDDHRKSVINCYKQMCNWLGSRGVSKASYQTPREFVMAAKNFLRISPGTLYDLTQIFEKARYSEHEINSEDRDKAIKCLNEIISAPVINIPANTPTTNGAGVVTR